MIKNKIKNIIVSHISKAFDDDIPDFTISPPPSGITGDYAINLPLLYARKNKLQPRTIADRVVEILKDVKELKNFSVAGGGFVNFDISDDFLTECLSEVVTSRGEEIYYLKENRDKKILIEFVSSNPTGPLHIGHARCAAIGDSLARVCEALGYGKVVREYYVNDLGLQVKMLEESVRARMLEIKGLPSEFPPNGYKGAYIYDIARSALAEFGENFADSADIGRFAVRKMLETTKDDLEAFDVKMDNYFSESSLKSKTDELMREFLDKGLAYERDGALWFGSSVPVSSSGEADDKDRVLKKRTGEYTYFATDIAYHKNKYERGFDEIVNVWGADHHGYVNRIKVAIRALGYDESRLKIILYQLVSLRRGQEKIAMSTRAGEFVTLKEVIDEVGKDATRFFLLMRAPDSSIDFDLELAKKQSVENPVYYVQYAHARICSVFNQAIKSGISAHTMTDEFILSGCAITSSEKREYDLTTLKSLLKILNTPPERDLIKSILSFGDVLFLSKKDLSAHHITTYLIDVSRKLHNFYEKCRVISPENYEITFARLALLGAVRKTLRLGLIIIGVSAPDKM